MQLYNEMTKFQIGFRRRLVQILHTLLRSTRSFINVKGTARL